MFLKPVILYTKNMTSTPTDMTSTPTDLVNLIVNMTLGGMVEQEVKLIRDRLSLRSSKYYLTRAGVHLLTSERTRLDGYFMADEPVWRFRMSDTDPLLPIFNEYVRQLSPYLVGNRN